MCDETEAEQHGKYETWKKNHDDAFLESFWKLLVTKIAIDSQSLIATATQSLNDLRYKNSGFR